MSKKNCVKTALMALTKCTRKSANPGRLGVIHINKVTKDHVVLVATDGHIMLMINVPVCVDWEHFGYDINDIKEGKIIDPTRRYQVFSIEDPLVMTSAVLKPSKGIGMPPPLSCDMHSKIGVVMRCLGANPRNGIHPSTWGKPVDGVLYNVGKYTPHSGVLLVMPIRYFPDGVKSSRYDDELGHVVFEDYINKENESVDTTDAARK